MAADQPTGLPSVNDVVAEVMRQLAAGGVSFPTTVVGGGGAAAAPSPGGAVQQPPAAHPVTPSTAAPPILSPADHPTTPAQAAQPLPPVQPAAAPAGPAAVATQPMPAAFALPPAPVLVGGAQTSDDARLAASNKQQARMLQEAGLSPTSSGYLGSSGHIGVDALNVDSFGQDFYGGPSAFPSRAAQLEYHANKIGSDGRATEAFKFRRSFFREVDIPEGANVQQTLLHRDRAYIGQWQAGMAHATNVGHAFFSSSPSADMQMGGALAGGVGSLGMMFGAPQVAIPAMIAGAGFNMLGPTVDFTYSKALEQARLERPRLQAQAMGVDLGRDSDLLRESTQMGFGQSEATWLLKQYYGSAGGQRRDGSMPMNPLAAHLGGVDIGAMAFFQQGGAPGGGAAEKDVNRAMSMAIGTGYETLGLRDSKLTEYLSRIAAATEGMKERGLKLDRENLVDFSAGLAVAGKGADVFQGVRGLQTGMRLSNESLGTAQKLMAPFGQLGEAALLSAAAKEGGSGFEVAARLQDWSKDPRKVYDVLSASGLSKDAMQSYYMASGSTAEEARILASGNIPKGMTKQMEDVAIDIPFFGKVNPFSGKGAQLGRETATLEQDVVAALKDLPGVLRELADVVKRGEQRKLEAGQGAGLVMSKGWELFLDTWKDMGRLGDMAVIPNERESLW